MKAREVAASQQIRPKAFVLPHISRTALYLTALVIIGLALRLWFTSVNAIDPRLSAADDGDYYRRALHFAVTGAYLDDSWLIRPPLHVFVFAALLRASIAIGDTSLGVPLIRAVQIGLSLLMIPMGYDLARRLFNAHAGLIFAALLAIWFPFVELPALILSEPLFLFCLLTHMWLLIRWRDAQTWPWLAASGIALGLAALTRSPALYASVFVFLFILLTTLHKNRESGQPRRAWIGRFIRLSIIFGVAMMLVIGPWTMRNYLVYGAFIPIDTLGPVNLWIGLHPDGIESGKRILAEMEQSERQPFVYSELARITREDPGRFTGNFWPHFQHIWKAQFIEDFLVKISFYTRPLRELWPLGVSGDLLWFGFTLSSLAALAMPLREGAFRWLALGWIAYTIFTVMLLHVEPRYLLPLWLLLALYGSWTIASISEIGRTLRRHWLNGLLAVGLIGGFLAIFCTYRDYPHIIAQGLQRERHHARGAQAYAANDLPTALREFQQMVDAHPVFIDGRIDLALVLIAQGRYDEAWQALGDRRVYRADMVRGEITRSQDKDDLASYYFTFAEMHAGEDVQALALKWLRPAPIERLMLGDGLDIGYLQGFSLGETVTLPSGEMQTYRWMYDRGQIVLPLPEPLAPGNMIGLTMASGLPEGAPLRVTFSNGNTRSFQVAGGQWHIYWLNVPAELAGQEKLVLRLEAPTFIPARQDPASADVRLLSVMVRTVEVK